MTDGPTDHPSAPRRASFPAATTGGPPRPGSPADREAALRARRERARQRARVQAQRRRRTALSLLVLIIVTVVLLSWSFAGSPAPHATGGSPTTDPGHLDTVALPSLTLLNGVDGHDSGSLPALPFPAAGEGAVAVAGSGVLAATADQQPVPVASLTKMMTAYLVLTAHPLTGDEQGPAIHFTAADHEAWIQASENDESNVELVAGEVLTERQLLEALLIPSADNVADWLARWVGGTESRFVGLMNATARRLGMDETHFADASGLDPASRSTAADVALLGSILMENPVIRSIVSLQNPTFPVAGHIWNYNPALGVDGIIGVKSGFTQAASGCLVTAAWHTVGGRRVLVIAAVTGQPLGLDQAAQADETLTEAIESHLQLVSPFGPTVTVATARVPWTGRAVDAVVKSPVRLAAWGGLRYRARLVGAPVTRAELRHGWTVGTVVADLVVSTQFGPAATVPVTLARAIPPPPAGSVTFRPAMTLSVR